MKTPKEKEKIVKKYLDGESAIKIAKENDIDRGRIYKWTKKYQEEGLSGLHSKAGKNSSSSKNKGLHLRKPKDRIEELEIEIIKKDIEIARLKKGYLVKGDGAKKEYVTTLDKNMK